MSSAEGGDWVNAPGDRKSRENCERVQREAVPIAGTVAETYLIKERGLQQPLWSELRWLHDARTAEGAIIAPLTVDGCIVGYQATFLDAFGRKSVIDPARQTWKLEERRTPSAVFALPVRGSGADVVICDGLEDALSIWTYARPKSRVLGMPGVWTLPHLRFSAGTKILIAPDGDPPGSPGAKWLHQGIDCLLLSGCEVLLARVPPVRVPKLDANQILVEKGVDALRAWLDQAEPAKLSNDGEVRRLAKLDILSYGMERAAAAKRLGIPVKFLDQAVEAMRKTIADEERAAREDFLDIDEVRPWDDEVDGAELLDDLAQTIRSYVVMTVEQSWAVALWTLFTWCFDAAIVSIKLWVKSAERRSGKTRLLELLVHLCRRPLGGSRMSPAAFYRLIEARSHPCLLIDEFDSFAADNEDFRGLLNAGFDRTEMSKVWMCVGDNHEPTSFDVFCPQVIAGIGKVSDTVADRCLRIELQRKTRVEEVKRLRRRDTKPLDDLARRCARWAKDNLPDLMEAEPDMPVTLHDRASDGWELLVAIADQAGDHWGKQAGDDGRGRRAALWISGDGEYQVDDDSTGIQLLYDIRAVLKLKAENVRSSDLVSWLINMEDRPWSAFKHGKPLSQFQLASQLRQYGVRPLQFKEGELKRRGYRVAGPNSNSLHAVFDRYLPPVEQDPEGPKDQPTTNGFDTRMYAETDLDLPSELGTLVPDEETCGSQADFDPVPETAGTETKTPQNPSKTATGTKVPRQNDKNGPTSAYKSRVSSGNASVSANSGDPDAPTCDQVEAPTGKPNGATEGYPFASVEEGARHYRAMHPRWSLARIAKEVGVSTSRIEELFPGRSPIVTKVRSVMAEHPDWTPEQISKAIRRPKSAVHRALKSIDQ